MDLFDATPSSLKPLAERLRPSDFDDFVGQKHMIGPGKLLTRLLENQHIPSMIFWGPPGVGKTTLARILSHRTQNRFVSLSAVTSNLKEVKEVIDAAKEAKKYSNTQTIVFIDEIHRFNKAQQDAFLPHVENGTITLIGATTENPSFEVIGALLSRCKVITFHPLDHEDQIRIIDRALKYQNHTPDFLDTETKDFLISNAYGDARYLLNVLEDLLAVFADKSQIEFSEARDHVVRRAAVYDKNAEHHYNVISAFIKSMRGSDPDAALYYLARMIDGGEDPLFIARRMVIFASEDIGLANPAGVQVAVSCMQAFDFVGMPEGWIPLAHCAAYLAGSPKSNSSYAGYLAALDDVKQYGPLDVPLHLRNAPTKLMKDLGYHKGYKYAHDYVGNVTSQQHLPDAIKNHTYYHPTANGHEKKISEWLQRVKNAKDSV